MASVEADIRAGKHKPGKKVKITTSKGVEREIDTRSQYYKTLQKRKEKDLRSGKPVFDKSNVHYTGLTRD
jgi:hypothetical protein